MNNIVRITIRGESGYCSLDSAYKELITIKPDGITYRYTPVMESKTNFSRKWSYRTDSPEYREIYDALSNCVEKIIHSESMLKVCDADTMVITAHYTDKIKESWMFCIGDEESAELSEIFRMMIPPREKMPKIAETYDSDEDE